MHDVFVSYSSKDKPAAEAVCKALEASGLQCWIGPRDILPGRDWGGSIIEAISGARVMVLIFSAGANSSSQIKREVERAVNKGIPVIPLRIEDTAPTDTLEYFISTPHWLDAYTPPLEQHLHYLVEVVQKIVGQDTDLKPASQEGRTPAVPDDFGSARAVRHKLEDPPPVPRAPNPPPNAPRMHPPSLPIDRSAQSWASPQRSGLGMASFIISVIAAIALFITFVVAGLLASNPEYLSGESPTAMIVGFVIFGLIFIDVIALGLGVVGIFKGAKKLWAALGIAISILSVFCVVVLMTIGLLAGA